MATEDFYVANGAPPLNRSIDFWALSGNPYGSPPDLGFGTEFIEWADANDNPLYYDPRFPIGGSFGGWHYGVQGFAGYADVETYFWGPRVNAYTEFAGVLGTGVYVPGTVGTSFYTVGVYGQTGESWDTIPTGFKSGVLGTAQWDPAVIGYADYGDGVQGWSYTGAGVRGTSAFQPGVVARSTLASGAVASSELGLASGVFGTCGPQGPKPPAGLPAIAGVFGSSEMQAGVIGTSSRTAGVLGVSNNVGVYGFGTNYAGIFQGNLVVTGTKSAVVPFPDGTQRALYCIESPELWFEDFGTAKLASGRAAVRIDPDFAKVIRRGDYRVFVTPEGDCNGLYVHRKSANAFEVRELAGGKSSVPFSYRIVGRRKDIRGDRRFAKFDMRLPPLAAAGQRPKPAPTAAGLRAFVARVEKETRESRSKGAPKVKRSPALPKHARRRVRLTRLATKVKKK